MMIDSLKEADGTLDFRNALCTEGLRAGIWNGRVISQSSYSSLPASDRSEKDEAKEHFDNAREAFIDGVAHSAFAGLAVEVPPVAAYEFYKAVESFKEGAKEYVAGMEVEEKRKSEKE
jgi:hypothetical protein